MKKQLIILKLGGSIITDKTRPYTPNLAALKRLSREIKLADVPVVVVHGQGSFAHTSAKKYGGKKGYKNLLGVVKVFSDAMEMNSVVMAELLKAKIPAVSFRPNSLFLSQSGVIKKSNLEPVLEALKQGIVPVLYGDVIMDTTWLTTIFSGEVSTRHLALFLARQKISIKEIIQVGVTDGVYDTKGKTIRQISALTYASIKKHLFPSKTTDVTGGMMHKVEEAITLAKLGIPTIILNGTRKNELYQTLKGKNSRFVTIVK
jgi:isopentenyl phosphate kinase